MRDEPTGIARREPPPLRDQEAPAVGAERHTPHGPIWVATTRYADGHRHGRAHVRAAHGWDPAALALLAQSPHAALPPERWAFLDVETTGLGMRAGTYVFLVGIGWLLPDGFHVEQHLLRDPSEEPALLHAVAAALAGFAGLVTFNGKAFDLPLLGMRAAMARRPPPHVGLAHCDLLHAARRAWSHRTASCRLVALEGRFLGLRRHGDLEGRLIPQVYLDYLRSGHGELLEPVLAHNRSDLLSLALLTAEAARFLERTRAGGAAGLLGDRGGLAEDRLRAARVYATAGDEASAAALLEICVAGAPGGAVRQAARDLLAGIARRQGDLARACRLWEEMLADEPHLVEPCAAIAKVLEHHRREPARALEWVERRLAGPALDPESRAALEHRRARLARKLQPGGWLGDLPAPA